MKFTAVILNSGTLDSRTRTAPIDTRPIAVRTAISVTLARDTEAMINARIAQIDHLISLQLNEVMHHPEFQKLEGSWRGLHDAFVHIADNGLSAFPVAELYNIDNAQMEACAMALAENPDFLIGVKVRIVQTPVDREEANASKPRKAAKPKEHELWGSGTILLVEDDRALAARSMSAMCVVRSEDGAIRLLFDSCRHRGAMICRHKTDNRMTLTTSLR